MHRPSVPGSPARVPHASKECSRATTIDRLRGPRNRCGRAFPPLARRRSDRDCGRGSVPLAVTKQRPRGLACALNKPPNSGVLLGSCRLALAAAAISLKRQRGRHLAALFRFWDPLTHRCQSDGRATPPSRSALRDILDRTPERTAMHTTGFAKNHGHPCGRRGRTKRIANAGQKTRDPQSTQKRSRTQIAMKGESR